MLYDFLKKRKKINEKKSLIKIMINNLNISIEQKSLYLGAFEVLNEENIDSFYNEITVFVESVEIKEIEEINTSSFSNINGIRKKEAEEKKKDLNSFNFLIHNI